MKGLQMHDGVDRGGYGQKC